MSSGPIILGRHSPPPVVLSCIVTSHLPIIPLTHHLIPLGLFFICFSPHPLIVPSPSRLNVALSLHLAWWQHCHCLTVLQLYLFPPCKQLLTAVGPGAGWWVPSLPRRHPPSLFCAVVSFLLPPAILSLSLSSHFAVVPVPTLLTAARSSGARCWVAGAFVASPSSPVIVLCRHVIFVAPCRPVVVVVDS